MPTDRLSMRRIRGLLRLKDAQGLSDRAIAVSLGLGEGAVGNYLARFSRTGLSWPLAVELDDDGLELLLFPSPTMRQTHVGGQTVEIFHSDQRVMSHMAPPGSARPCDRGRPYALGPSPLC